jgi:hypothetical protein
MDLDRIQDQSQTRKAPPRWPVRWLGALGVLMLSGGMVLGLTFLATPSAPIQAASNDCSCVLYVRSVTGLSGGPATAAGYTESVMSSMGYKKVNPTAGAILVWDAWQKGAYGDGHMAIINSAGYDYSISKWQISVRQVNWAGNCNISDTSFTTWGDLYGVNAYVRS